MVFVELTSSDLVEKLINENGNCKKYTLDGEIYPINISKYTETTLVRIHHLPPSVSNQTITYYIQQYGVVSNVTDEDWNQNYEYPVKNGVRRVQMRIKNPYHLLYQ